MELVTLIQETYTSHDEARTVLINIGYPAAEIPVFKTAHTFWPQVLRTLDAKVVNGKHKLLKATVDANPGLRVPADLLDGLAWTSAQIVPELIPGGGPGGDGWPQAQGADDVPPPTPPPFPEESGVLFDTEECPTLTLEGANLPEPFLALVLEMFGRDEVALLYVARAQSAVRIPDPGDRDEAVRQAVQERMHTLAPSCRVTYRKFPFRPYLYTKLIVFGPDTSGYELEHVPATSTPEDIAAAVVAETREAQASTRTGLVRVVVDHGSPELGRRLDPYATLHECGVRDGDELRVAPDAIAGSLAPELRVTALLRAAAQLRGYAARHPEFAITGYDDEELPTRITIEIGRKGLAPPADLDRFLVADGPESLEELVPVLVRSHRVGLHFPAMFPLVAPLVVWETPLFHPNVRHASLDGFPAGTLQFHPLLLGYQPELDLAHIARVITDVAMYRDYDLTDGSTSPFPVAAEWAGTDAGQTAIKAIGGRPLADVVREGDRRRGPVPLLWLKPLGEVPHGH